MGYWNEFNGFVTHTFIGAIGEWDWKTFQAQVADCWENRANSSPSSQTERAHPGGIRSSPLCFLNILQHFKPSALIFIHNEPFSFQLFPIRIPRFQKFIFCSNPWFFSLSQNWNQLKRNAISILFHFHYSNDEKISMIACKWDTHRQSQ